MCVFWDKSKREDKTNRVNKGKGKCGWSTNANF